MLGFNTDSVDKYSTEKNNILKSYSKAKNLKQDYPYLKQYLESRGKEADTYLTTLPQLMKEIFDHLLSLVNKKEKDFYSEVSEVIRKQQGMIRRDIQSKVPAFNERLQKKYNQLMGKSAQGATSKEDQIALLEKNIKTF